MLHHRLRQKGPFVAAPGQVTFYNTGTTDWIVPAGVTSVCILCIGAGRKGFNGNATFGARGGGGGALAYANNVTVSPWETLTVAVPESGNNPTDASVSRGATTLVLAKSATTQDGGSAASCVGDAAYSGGTSGTRTGTAGSGGGGAAGYAGNGGNGGDGGSGGGGAAGTGGGGGGGGGGSSGVGGGGGGGTGEYGQGTSGGTSSVAAGGKGGSLGTTGLSFSSTGLGGIYGGGGGGAPANNTGGLGGQGVVRIIWGANRAYPSTNTGNV